MPATFQNITARTVASCYGGGNANVKPNTFIRDAGLSGFAILIGRTKSSYVVEGRAGRGGRVVRYTLGTVGRLGPRRGQDAGEGKDRRTRPRRRSGTKCCARSAAPRSPYGRRSRCWPAGRDVKPSTVADYERSLVALGWMDRRLAGIKSADVLAAYDARREHPTSTARIFRSFRAAWNAARAAHPDLAGVSYVGAAQRAPIMGGDGATETARHCRCTPAGMAETGCGASNDDDVRDLLLFLHYSGCRVGESKALTAAEVYLEAGRYTLAASRRMDSLLILPITKQLHAILARRLAAVDEGLEHLFPQGGTCASCTRERRRGRVELSQSQARDSSPPRTASVSTTRLQARVDESRHGERRRARRIHQHDRRHLAARGAADRGSLRRAGPASGLTFVVDTDPTKTIASGSPDQWPGFA